METDRVQETKMHHNRSHHGERKTFQEPVTFQPIYTSPQESPTFRSAPTKTIIDKKLDLVYVRLYC